MKNIFRKLWRAVVLGLVSSLLLASPALAAGTDVTFSVDTTINLTGTGISVTVSGGSQVTSYVVNPTTIVFTLGASSSVTLRSANKYGLGNSLNKDVQCTASNTIVTFSGADGSSVIVTPTTGDSCVGAGGGGGGSSGGSGGGTGGGGGTPSTPGTPPPMGTPNGTPAEQPSTTTGTVTATASLGGTTTYTSTDPASPSLNVTLPPGAVSVDTTVTVTPQSLEAAGITVGIGTVGATGIIGTPYNITASSGGAGVTNFSQPVTLTFTYNISQLPAGTNPSDLVIMYFDTVANNWVSLPATVNTTTGTISANTGHFTVYVVAVKPGANSTVTHGGYHPNGTLILDGKTIFLIRNGQLAGFRNPDEYKSHGYNFGQAVAANAQDKALPQGMVIKALEGTLVIDAQDGKTVYMIGTGGTKRGFASAAVFKALGYAFGNLPKINLADYPSGPAINSALEAHPDGALVLDGKTIWWISGNLKQGFESMAVFNTFGFSVAKAVKANAADVALSQGILVKFRDGTLVKDGSAYYIISDGKKLEFSSSADLAAKGYKAGNAIMASLANYASGGSVQ